MTVVVDKLTTLKLLCLKGYRTYMVRLTKGYSPSIRDYKKIKAAMRAIGFIEDNEVDPFLVDALLDYHIININKL